MCNACLCTRIMQLFGGERQVQQAPSPRQRPSEAGGLRVCRSPAGGVGAEVCSRLSRHLLVRQPGKIEQQCMQELHAGAEQLS